MKYLKEHKALVILTLVLTLLPMAAGLLLWNTLPDQVPTHFNTAGEVDAWSSKPWVVFFLPCFLGAMHLLCLFMMNWAPKGRESGQKNIAATLWVCPAISILAAVVSYGTALGYPMDVNFVMILAAGFGLALIGLYLPKCRPNGTVGIKLSWTLQDEENWRYTHQLAGKVWMVCGLAIIVTSFLRSPILLAGILVVMILVPCVASYRHYRATHVIE